MTQAPLMDRIHITEDYDVPRVINGGWQLSAGHALERPLDLADASRAFNRLIDMGFDTFDCADIYTGVEDFFGGIIRDRRKDRKSTRQNSSHSRRSRMPSSA